MRWFLASRPLHYYQWHGIQNSGSSVQGVICARYKAEVYHWLALQKITAKQINVCHVSPWKGYINRITPQDLNQFYQQLATILESGISLAHALQLLLASQTKKEMSALLFGLQQQIFAGIPLSQAMKNYTPLIDPFSYYLIEAGEASGKLPHLLSYLSDYKDKQQRLRNKLQLALIYPLTVISVAIIIFVVMLLVVLPEFETLFNSFNASLPWLTRSLITLSHWLNQYALLLFILIVIFVMVLIKLLNKRPQLKISLSAQLIKLPIWGKLIQDSAVSHFCHTLALSSQAGLPVLQSVNLALNTTDQRYFQYQLKRHLTLVEAGIPISQVLRQSTLFPEIALQMILVGEESGKFEPMLAKVAHYYQLQVEDKISTLTKILEPMIIILLGGLIGSFVIALYLPIFSLISVF